MEEGALDAPGHRYSERCREMGRPFGNTFNSRDSLRLKCERPRVRTCPGRSRSCSHVVSETGMVLLWTQLVRRDLRGSRTFY
jgi:hypothetical protein